MSQTILSVYEYTYEKWLVSNYNEIRNYIFLGLGNVCHFFLSQKSYTLYICKGPKEYARLKIDL